MRFFERRWPLEKSGEDDRLIMVDRVYTVLNKLGIIPLAIFILTYPLVQEIELTVRTWGYAPPRLERLLPWIGRQRAALVPASTSCSTTSRPTGCTGHSTPSAGGGRCTACITASAA